MSFSKYIVLGSSGFIGKSLLHDLNQKKLKTFGFSSSALDLTQASSYQKLGSLIDSKTAVIMLAGITLDRQKDSPQVYEKNRAMLQNLADFMISHPPAYCLYTSTVSVYGDEISNTVITEETPVRPSTYYGKAKYAGEELLEKTAAKAHFPLLILRLCRVYGPCIPHANYGPVQFIQSILASGKVSLYGDGKELRDQLFVEDLVGMVTALMEKKTAGLFNAATGEAISFVQIIKLLKQIISEPFEIDFKPRTRPLIDQKFDIQKLLAALSDFHFTALEDGLRQTYQSLRTKSKR